jgi:hypothetical protein
MRYLLVAALTLGAGAAAAQGAPSAQAPHVIVAAPDQINWAPAPPLLPPGAKLAVLEGNPSEAGDFTMRLLKNRVNPQKLLSGRLHYVQCFLH